MPNWLWIMIMKKATAHRPQASFLPLIEDKGTNPAAPQPSLTKTLEILKSQGRVSVQASAV
jgi:hypothetical protein